MRKVMGGTTVMVNFRISPELLMRLNAACKHGTYEISASQIMRRGLELALNEIERKNP